ncbi:RNA-binding protein [Jiella sp. M17.18]|uniref:RNA-binding protein n=1 Tax=Jiella sp. M17.18 TaxID=3234247 RepID=UPI0034DE5F3C
MAGTRDVGDGDEVLNDRTCIVSRTARPADDLIRFVRDPQGEVVPDLRRRLPGRGAHVAFSRASVDEAVRRKLFARSFRAETVVPADLGARVDALLVRSACGALGLARKAGQLVTGAEKAGAAIRSGRAILLVQALDAAPDGIRKLDAARHAAAGGVEDRMIPALRLIHSDELGLALGGVNVIHAAILAGDAGSAARRRLEALAKYRGERPDPAHGDGPSGRRGRQAETENDTGAPSERRSGQDEGCGTGPAQEAEA